MSLWESVRVRLDFRRSPNTHFEVFITLRPIDVIVHHHHQDTVRSVCRFAKLCDIRPLQPPGSGQCAPLGARNRGVTPTCSRHYAADPVAKAAGDESRWGFPAPQVVCVHDLAALELSNCGLPCHRPAPAYRQSSHLLCAWCH